MGTSRKLLLAGNWKLHHNKAASEALVRAISSALQSTDKDIAVAPVFTALDHIRGVLAALSEKRIRLAAQNLYFEPHGAFTGEVSAAHLVDVGCDMAIVGHSERRQLFGESDAWVAKKTKVAIEAGLEPIVCVGETLAEREAGTTLQVVERQMNAVTAVLEPQHAVTFAYEPVWAIGTGKVAKPEDAQEVHAMIRDLLQKKGLRANELRILYGGSVKPENARELLDQPDIDGALIGGASLTVEAFMGIVNAR